jgi:hypothetical protein
MRVVSILAGILILAMQPASVPDDPSFVHAFTDGVWFLQWTDRDGTLAGQLQSVAVQPDLTLRSTNQALSGIRNGADITLNLGGTLGGAPLGAVYTCRLRGSTLVLNIPLQNGTMETVVFQSGTVEDYNRAVAALRVQVDKAIQERQQEIDRANRERQREAELAARQRAVVLGNQRLRGLMFAVQTASDQLKKVALDFGPVLDQFSEDWARMQRDYETLKADAAQQPLTCMQLEVTVTNDLRVTLENDLQVTLRNDNEVTFANRQRAVTDATSRLAQTIQETQQAFADLQAAVKQNTLGTPSPALTEAQVQTVIVVGHQQIRDANAAVSAAAAQKERILADANVLYRRAREFVASLRCTQ